MAARTRNEKRKTKNDNTPISTRPSGAAQTMEELLAKTGYQPRGLIRGQEVEGTVVELGPKSLVADIGAKSEGLVVDEDFEAAKAYIKTLKPGDKVKAVVLVPEAEAGQALLSLKGAAEKYIWDSFEEKFKNGDKIEARVEGTTRGGLTGEVYGIVGFIPTSHLGAGLSENPQVAVGKSLTVKIIECDRSKGRLVLSEKAVSEAELIEKQKQALESINVGEKFAGTVTRVVEFGVFVKIDKGGIPLEGLVHLSELAWGKVGSPTELYSEGDEVEVVVIGKEEARLALSVKQTQKDPWQGVDQKYKPDIQVTGKVTKTGDFGAFVELEPGIEGLIHAGKVPADRSLKEGEQVDVFIEEIDPKNRRLSLGLALKKAPVGYK